MNYQMYLSSKAWDVLRKKAYERAGNRCEFCNKAAAHVHHIRYPKEFYLDSLANVVVVCEKCHELLHGIRNTDPEDIIIPKGTWQEAICDGTDSVKFTDQKRNQFWLIAIRVNGSRLVNCQGYKCVDCRGVSNTDGYGFVCCIRPEHANKVPSNLVRFVNINAEP